MVFGEKSSHNMVASGGKWWQVLDGSAEWRGPGFASQNAEVCKLSFRFHHAMLPFGGGGFNRFAHSAGPGIEKHCRHRTDHRRRAQHTECFLCLFGSVVLCYVLSSVAYLAARPAAPHICKHVENPLVFTFGLKTGIDANLGMRTESLKKHWKT